MTFVVALAAGLMGGCTTSGDESASTSGVSVADGPVINIAWRPNPVSVDGYTIYYGSTSGTVDNRFRDFTIASGQIDPNSPQVKISAYYDLGLRDGERVCISIRAFNRSGTSQLSTPVCTVVN